MPRETFQTTVDFANKIMINIEMGNNTSLKAQLISTMLLLTKGNHL